MSLESLDTFDYIYSKWDLLDKPQTYQRSPFVGIKFLDSYKQNRLEVLNKINIPNDFSYQNFINNIQNVYQPNTTFELEHYLEYLLKNSQVNSKSVDIILKKFEVKKQLFTKYNSDFKELSDDFRLIRNYLLLSILCIELYRHNYSLKYLNCCLKINDTVISQLSILDNSDRMLLKYSVQNELEFIEQLCLKKGITL